MDEEISRTLIRSRRVPRSRSDLATVSGFLAFHSVSTCLVRRCWRTDRREAHRWWRPVWRLDFLDATGLDAAASTYASQLLGFVGAQTPFIQTPRGQSCAFSPS